MSGSRVQSPNDVADLDEITPAPPRKKKKNLSNGARPREDHVTTRTKHHMAKLPSTNVGVHVPSFAKNPSASVLDLAVVRSIEIMAAGQRRERRHVSKTNKRTPARPVVVVVSSDSRARLILNLLRTNSHEKVVVVPSPSIEKMRVAHIQTFFDAHDVVIVRDWWAADQLASDKLKMVRIGLLVFDGAESATSPAHAFCGIMRENYRCLSPGQRPRVFAIGICEASFAVLPVEEHLFVEFPTTESLQVWKPVSWFDNHDDSLVFVETVKYKNFAPKKGDRLDSDIPDTERLKNELGFLAVACYGNLFQRRRIAKVYGERFRKATGNRIGDVDALHGLTEKALSVLGILQRAFVASTEEDNLLEENSLMAVVHAGHAVVAVGLYALICELAGFKGVVARVLLGDSEAAKPLEREAGTDDERGLQGQETDDDAVDEFGVGDANILIVASKDIDEIERTRRPIPPAPLVIRFDGTLADPDKDAGGGHCRVVVFKGESGQRRDDPHRHRRRKKKDNKAAGGAGRSSNGGKEPDGVQDHEPYIPDETTEAANGRAGGWPKPKAATSPVTPVGRAAAGREDNRGAKKRKLPTVAPANTKRPRGSLKKPAEPTKADEDVRTRTVTVADALVGPGLDDGREYFLYGFRLQEHRDQLFVDRKEREIRNWGGLERFGVVLSEELDDNDRNISLGDLGLQCAVDKEVGTIGLVLIGSVRFSSEEVLQVREYMMSVFSSIMGEVDRNSFNWDVFDKEDFTDTPKKAGYYRQYLVVPVDEKRERIRWEDVSRLVEHTSNDIEENAARAEPCPARGDAFQAHLHDLELSLLYVIGGPRLRFGGMLRHDQSPLSYFVRNKKFLLDDVGSFVEDPDIQYLVDTVEDSDSEKLAEKSPFLPCNQKDLSPAAASTLPKARLGGKKTQFSPFRNRKKGRTEWVGRFLQTHEDFQRSRGNHLQYLDQPLIATSDPPAVSMENLIETLRGYPVKQVLEVLARSAEKPRSLVPEICRPHPIPVGAVFLPACLLGMERHLLLCELRKTFASKTDVDSMRLRWISQALTSHVTNPEENYERLEFLGDAVLKYSCTLRIFTLHPHYNEGRMHQRRALVIANDALKQKALKHDLQKFLCFRREVVGAWMPPGYSLQGRTVRLNQKSLADVVEALCGVMFLCGSERFQLREANIVDLTNGDEDGATRPNRENINPTVQKIEPIVEGYKAGVAMLEAFDVFDGKEPTHLETMLSTIHSLHPRDSAPPTEIVPEAFPRDPRLARPEKPWEEEYGPLEVILGYTFKRRHLLMCALTHGSYIDSSFESKTMADAFQRLEFLGDAVVDFIVVLYLYDQYPQLAPGPLTDLKGRVVSNETFARVSVQYGLHDFLSCASTTLNAQIARFDKTVQEELDAGGNAIYDEELVDACAAPKALGDVFEAILGAILVDSGFEATWNVAMKLLKQTLENRANPGVAKEYPTVRLHHVIHREKGITSKVPEYVVKKVKGDGDKYECTVKVVGVAIATARGTKERRAKLLAARKALERLEGEGDEKLMGELRERAARIDAEVMRHC